MGSAARILAFQNVLSWASSGVIRLSAYPFGRNPSIHLPLGLPLGAFSWHSRVNNCSHFVVFFHSLHVSYQRSLISLTFSCILFTPSSFRMSTLFTLSLSVTPLILLNILISVFSRICSSFFLTAHHSGIMTVM